MPRRLGRPPSRGDAVPFPDRASDPGDRHEPADLVTADLEPGAAGSVPQLAHPGHAQFSRCSVTSALARQASCSTAGLTGWALWA